MGAMSGWHWVIVIAVAIVLFGAKRLPDTARALGRSMRIFRAELHGSVRDEQAGPPRATVVDEPAADTDDQARPTSRGSSSASTRSV